MIAIIVFQKVPDYNPISDSMGWYLRKSVGFGPLRLNLSKSGLGYSVGVKGARIGSGPRGNYVHLGRSGIYYRKYFNGPTTPRLGPASAVEPAQVVTLGIPITSASASQLRDVTSESLVCEIREKEAKTPLAPISAVLSALLVAEMLAFDAPFWAALTVIPALVAIFAYLSRVDYESKVVILNYELDGDARKHYAALLAAFQSLAGSARTWRVTSRNPFIDRKYHAGATVTVERKQVSIDLNAPEHLQTGIAVWSIKLGDQSLYFFPDRILVYGSGGVGAVNYGGFVVHVEHKTFVEDESVPQDAQVISHTWQYVNKDGGPDRRFGNNRQLPVLLYAETTLRSASGMNIVLHSSNPANATAFQTGFISYVNHLAHE